MKKEGDRVKEGETIADVETDKATMPMEAFEAGTLAVILVKEGEKVTVGAPIGVLALGKENPADVKKQYAGSKGGATAPAATAESCSAPSSPPPNSPQVPRRLRRRPQRWRRRPRRPPLRWISASRAATSRSSRSRRCAKLSQRVCRRASRTSRTSTRRSTLMS